MPRSDWLTGCLYRYINIDFTTCLVKPQVSRYIRVSSARMVHIASLLKGMITKGRNMITKGKEGINREDTVKCLVLGDAMVGKTTLIKSLLGIPIPDRYETTVFLDFYTGVVSLPGSDGKKMLTFTDFSMEVRYCPLIVLILLQF